MNQVRVVVDDLSGPQIAAFLDEHVQELRAITPPESKYALDLDGLRRPEITFWSVLDGDAVVGCRVQVTGPRPCRAEVDAGGGQAAARRHRLPAA